MRRRFSVSLKGARLADLMRLASQLHLAPRALRLDMEHLSQLKLPAILHWDLNHFVVLKEVKSDRVVIHDPAHGVRSLPMAEVSKHFTGVGLELAPTADFKPAEERQRVTVRALIGRVIGLKRSLIQIVVLAIAIEVFALIGPFFLQWVVDSVVTSADRQLLTTLGIGFLLLVAMQVATSAIRSWAVLYLSNSLNLQWLANVFSHLLRLPMAWFERRHIGDVLSRFGAINQIQQTLTTSFIEAILDGLLVVVTLAMMFYYSPSLTAIALAAVVLYGLSRWATFQPLRGTTEEYIVHAAKQNSHFLESLRAVQSIKLFGREDDRQSRYLNQVVDTMNADIGVKKIGIGMVVFNQLVFGAERIAVIWVGALLVLDRQFSVGMLFAFLAYKDQFASRISGLIDKAVDLRMLRLQSERLADIVLTAPESAGHHSVESIDAIEPSIEVDNVSFRYSDAEPFVLKNCSLRILPGESVAIVGPSGCGKTTLLKLLLGIHAPQEGQVRIGGVPIQRLGLQNYRSIIGTVMQDDQLLAGSIADNITFFDPTPDQTHLEYCARVASIHEEVLAMPMAYATLIGDMGTSLSGGQRQRILLARALYKRPRLLFLDEATSALDVDRERLVNIAVKQLNLTRIVIAHRPETIAAASRVIVLSDGRVTQDLRAVVSGHPLEVG